MQFNTTVEQLRHKLLCEILSPSGEVAHCIFHSLFKAYVLEFNLQASLFMFFIIFKDCCHHST